jgi:alkanesulfonate monooxygenase SsuD/methylene tetrahydromethanopterin reductase-like flavin-dependent oxidoreductase (luciferase family)
VSLDIGIGLFTAQVPPGSGRQFKTEYAEILEMCRLAEDAGFGSAWVSEHHGAADGYLPSLNVMLAAIAAVTRKIGLAMGVVLAPFQEPLRFAEDCAVVDQISGGRLTVGLALGWREEEFRAFNIPTGERVGRTEELVEICRRAWSEDRFSFKGKYFRFERVAVTPKPAHRLPILMGGFAEASVRRAGRLGDGFLASRGSLSSFTKLVEMFDTGAREAGRDPAELQVGFLKNVFATKDGKVPDEIWNAIWHQVGTYIAWENTDTPEAAYKLPPLDRSIVADRTIMGTPQQVVEQLTPWIEKFASRNLRPVFRLHYPGMTRAQAQPAIELFASEVMPWLRKLVMARTPSR